MTDLSCSRTSSLTPMKSTQASLTGSTGTKLMPISRPLRRVSVQTPINNKLQVQNTPVQIKETSTPQIQETPQTFRPRANSISISSKPRSKRKLPAKKLQQKTRKTSQPEKFLCDLLPNQLEVIRCIKRFKCPAFTREFRESRRSKTRKLYSAFSQMPKKLKKRIEFRRNQKEVEVPTDSKVLGQLLKKMQQTDRILRQDIDFLTKVREFKTDIQLTAVKKQKYVDPTVKPKYKGLKERGIFPSPPCEVLQSQVIIHKNNH